MTRQALVQAVALPILAAAVLAACVRTAAVRYYTLPSISEGGDERLALETEHTHLAVRVGAASIPDSLDRPQMVLRLSPTEVTVDDGHRWAEPLRTAIGRAVAAGLQRDLAGARVAFADDTTAHEAGWDVDVALEVLRMDLEPGRQAFIEAVWVARWANGAGTQSGHSMFSAAAGTGRDELAAASADALVRLSDDIAAALLRRGAPGLDVRASRRGQHRGDRSEQRCGAQRPG